jgi:cytochrome c551/c552
MVNDPQAAYNVSGSMRLLASVVIFVFLPGPRPALAQTAASERALLNQYCVTCHNDKLKTANFSLQNLDLASAGDHPEIWEQVIRKLRAGMMPPPGMPRPPLAKYEQLRDWLEAEVDRKAAEHPDPGSVVLHRLNRTEYGNAIRDLLGLQVDVNSLLPPDDSARGFDNVAGSLTISPTLLEAYMTAATRISRMAVGYWKSPTAAAFIAPPDSSQNEHIEGLPFGTRGGIAVRHTFPSDGEYHFSVQNLGIGKFIPGEKLEFLIDNQMVAAHEYKGVGLTANNAADHDGSIDGSRSLQRTIAHRSITSGNTSANRSRIIRSRSLNITRPSGS